MLVATPIHAEELRARQSAEASTRPDTRALTGGALLFAVSYGLAGAAAVQGYFGEHSEWAAVPVAGPWILVPRAGGSQALVLDGVGQLGGVALVAGSFMFPERTLGPARASAPSVQVNVGRASSSVGLAVRF